MFFARCLGLHQSSSLPDYLLWRYLRRYYKTKFSGKKRKTYTAVAVRGGEIMGSLTGIIAERGGAEVGN